MKICSIDVGTNSILYLLAQIDCTGRLTPLAFAAKTTRLGKSLTKKGILTSEAQHRTITTIKQFLKDAVQKGAIHYILAGTSALREAKNTTQFTQRLYKESGKHLTILTETQEAKLAFSAVKHFIKIEPGKTVIIDIGGGSTELIYCIRGRLIKTKSIPIGAVNLTEKFRDNVEEIEEFIKARLRKLLAPYNKWEKTTKLIGVGGTITTLGAIIKGLKRYDPKKVHKHTVTFSKVAQTINKLTRLTMKQRQSVIPFDPKRSDIIVAGLVILKVLMELFNVGKIKICDRGLVYGLALNYSKYTRGTLSLHNIS